MFLRNFLSLFKGEMYWAYVLVFVAILKCPSAGQTIRGSAVLNTSCFSVILIYPRSLFSHFTISSVMTDVTFPLRPPRLAFAICGRRCMAN